MSAVFMSTAATTAAFMSATTAAFMSAATAVRRAATAVRLAATRCRVRSWRRARCRRTGSWSAGAHRYSMTRARARSAGMRNRRVTAGWAAATVRKTAAIGCWAAAAVIVSATIRGEAMAAPAVAVAPSSPWAHAQEDAVVEVSWPVIAVGRAGVWGVVVVAVLTNRLHTDADKNLGLSRWRQGQTGEQCRCTE
jgi:hypothetical protein